MSRHLSLEDERLKIQQYMTAPVLVQTSTTTVPLPHRPPLTVPHINLQHYPEHVDFPDMWRAIQQAVRQRVPFTWY